MRVPGLFLYVWNSSRLFPAKCQAGREPLSLQTEILYCVCVWPSLLEGHPPSHVAPLGSSGPPLQSSSTATRPHPALMPWAVPSGWLSLCPPMLHFVGFLPAHFSDLLESLWAAALPSHTPTAPCSSGSAEYLLIEMFGCYLLHTLPIVSFRK